MKSSPIKKVLSLLSEYSPGKHTTIIVLALIAGILSGFANTVRQRATEDVIVLFAADDLRIAWRDSISRI